MPSNQQFIFISGFANDSRIFLPLIEAMEIEANQYQLMSLPMVRADQINQNQQAVLNHYVNNFEKQISQLTAKQNHLIVASSLAGMLVLKLFANNQLKFINGAILIGVNLSFIQRANWKFALQKSTFNRFKTEFNQGDKGRKRFFNLELWGDQFDEHISKKNAQKILAAMEVADFVSEKTLLQLLSELDLTEAIQTIKKPMQFIFGQNDTLVPIDAKSAVEQIFSTKANLSTGMVENSGHLPMLTHPKKCQQIIKSFLDNQLQ